MVIPFLAFFSLFLLIGNLDKGVSWRLAFLRTAVLWGSYAIISAEILSLPNWITPIGLSLVWLLALSLIVGIFSWWIKRGGALRWPKWQFPSDWLVRLLSLCILVIVLITGLLAWVAPPQAVDSLHYHMSRVAHWAQNKSLRHFATGIEVQNSRSPGAQIIILHFYVLSGGDRLANFVQWFSMVGSLIGVSLLVRQLGGNTLAEILSVTFTASLPMGIAQASSTMTDYVVAFWVVCIASESLRLYKDATRKRTLVFLSLATGLVLVSKPTSVPYLIPFAIFTAAVLFKHYGLVKSISRALTTLGLILVLNAGYLTRNYYTYDSFFNPQEFSLHKNEVMSLKGLISNLLRNAGLQAGTPWPKINKEIYRAITAVHVKMELDLNDPRTTAHGYFAVGRPNTFETSAGNPAHALMALIIFVLLIIRFRFFGKGTLIYGLVVVSTFTSFSFMFKWQIWGSRYLLPFFVLIAPLTAHVLVKSVSQNVVKFMGIALILLSWPWLVGIYSRPLIDEVDMHPVGSVLSESRENLLFANIQKYEETYITIVDKINEAQCAQIGLMISGASMEYPLWVLLDSPRDDLTLEWIVAGTPSAQYERSDFIPCAVICQNCPEDWKEVRGLPSVYEVSGFQLFLHRE